MHFLTKLLKKWVGAVESEHPKGIDPKIVTSVDRVVVLGTEANSDEFVAAACVEIWEIDELSLRGINGIERLRLVRGEISSRVLNLDEELTQ